MRYAAALVILCLCSCVNPRHEAAQGAADSARKAFNTYRAAVVPHPSYGDEGVAGVNSLGNRIAEALVEASR